MKCLIFAAFLIAFICVLNVQAQINIHLGGHPVYDRPYVGGYYGPGYGAAYGPRPYTGPYTGLYAGGPVQPKYGYAERGYYGFRNPRIHG